MTKKIEKPEAKRKKLVINTETIRNLTATELTNVAGGCSPPPTGSRGQCDNCP